MLVGTWLMLGPALLLPVIGWDKLKSTFEHDKAEWFSMGLLLSALTLGSAFLLWRVTQNYILSRHSGKASAKS